MKGHFTPHTKETKLKISLSKIGTISPRRGIKLSDETKRKISLSKKGSPNWNKGGVAPWAVGNKHGLGRIPWNKGKKVLATSGLNNTNWKGGITKNTRCVDCNKIISWRARRCQDCFHNLNKAENHYNWQGGITPFYRKLRLERLTKNGGSYTRTDWEELKKKYNYMCLCCKKFEPEIKLTADHIIPVALGGSGNINNIQPLCQSCNSIKWSKIIDFRQELSKTK